MPCVATKLAIYQQAFHVRCHDIVMNQTFQSPISALQNTMIPPQCHLGIIIVSNSKYKIQGTIVFQRVKMINYRPLKHDVEIMDNYKVRYNLIDLRGNTWDCGQKLVTLCKL